MSKQCLSPRATLVIVALLALSSACTPPGPEERLARAEAANAQGDARTAMIELRNLLRDDPENAQARLLLGRTALAMGDPATAEKELQRAVELGVSADTVRVPLSRAYLQLGNYEGVIARLDGAAATDDPEADADVHVLRGNAQIELRDLEAAREEYMAALELDPDSLDARLGLAQLSGIEGDLSATESIPTCPTPG